MIHLFFKQILPFSVSFQTARCFLIPHKHARPRTYIHSVLFRVYLQKKNTSRSVHRSYPPHDSQRKRGGLHVSFFKNVARVSDSQLLKK